MQINKEFIIIDAHAAMDAATQYYTSNGFDQVESGHLYRVFTKGKVWTNFFTFDPLNWKSRTTIKAAGNTLFVDCVLDTVGQMVTAKETQKWHSFFNQLSQAIGSETEGVTQTAEEEAATSKQNVKKLVGTGVGILFGTFGFRFLSDKTGNPGIAFLIIMAFAGVAALWEKRKR